MVVSARKIKSCVYSAVRNVKFRATRDAVGGYAQCELVSIIIPVGNIIAASCYLSYCSCSSGDGCLPVVDRPPR